MLRWLTILLLTLNCGQIIIAHQQECIMCFLTLPKVILNPKSKLEEFCCSWVGYFVDSYQVTSIRMAGNFISQIYQDRFESIKVASKKVLKKLHHETWVCFKPESNPSVVKVIIHRSCGAVCKYIFFYLAQIRDNWLLILKHPFSLLKDKAKFPKLENLFCFDDRLQSPKFSRVKLKIFVAFIDWKSLLHVSNNLRSKFSLLRMVGEPTFVQIVKFHRLGKLEPRCFPS